MNNYASFLFIVQWMNNYASFLFIV